MASLICRSQRMEHIVLQYCNVLSVGKTVQTAGCPPILYFFFCYFGCQNAKIEVKVDTCNIKIIFQPLCNSKIKNVDFKMTPCT